MDASIKDPNIKHFVRLLQCASKFGDDLHMFANKDAWELSVTNSSKSAYCLFKLRKEFFCRWKPVGTLVRQRRGVKCCLLVKSVLAVLGKSTSVNNVERIDLKIYDPDESLREKRRRSMRQETNGTGTGNGTGEEEEEYEGSGEEREGGLEAKLVMKLVCKHVTKKHSLHLASSQFLRAEVDPNSTPSGFSISARSLKDMLDHFNLAISSSNFSSGPTSSIRNDNQLGWLFAKRQVRIKSWDGGSKDLQTEIVVDPGEFDEYEIVGDRVDLTIPMREFRATLALAEQLNLSLGVDFSEATQPLTMTYNPGPDDNGDPTDSFEIFAAIATTSCDVFGSVDIGTSASDNKPDRTRSVNSDAVGPRRNQPPADNRERSGTTEPPRRSQSDSSRKRPRLSMTSSQNQNGSQAQVVVNSAPLMNQARANRADRPLPLHDGQEPEPLFLPDDIQAPPDDETVPPPSSQRMSQAEAMRMAGLGDIRPDELGEELEDAEEEDELEEMDRDEEKRRSEVDLDVEEERTRGQSQNRSEEDGDGRDRGKGKARATGEDGVTGGDKEKGKARATSEEARLDATDKGKGKARATSEEARRDSKNNAKRISPGGDGSEGPNEDLDDFDEDEFDFESSQMPGNGRRFDPLFKD